MDCCEDHKCTYKRGKIECGDVVTCYSRYYCAKHAKIYACRYKFKNGEECGKSIYYAFYKKGIRFCQEHQCRFMDCKNKINENCDGLCSQHYYAQIFCQYICDDGKQCNEVIGRNQYTNECGLSIVDLSLEDDEFDEDDDTNKNETSKEADTTSVEIPPDICIKKTFYNKQGKYTVLFEDNKPSKYCIKHTCCIDYCKKHRINDLTPWCKYHAFQCEYVSSDGKKCANYYTAFHSQEEKWKKDCHLCEEHRCQWTGNTLMDTSMCCAQIEIHDDCKKYCALHYTQFLFYKYEFA
jgi:hypothetical protein